MVRNTGGKKSNMQNIWNEKCIFSPSLICLDMCNLESQIRILEASGVQMLHVDILDGHFSPSMPLGLDTVRQLRAKTNLAFDCHVMVTEQDYFVDELLDIGVEQIVFHGETQPHIDGMLNRIHAKGVRAGVALKPSTPLAMTEYVLEKCDTVLLMLINPGYAFMKGEKQVSYADRKIRDLRRMIDERGLDTKIEVDGRISPQNIQDYGAGEVDIFVTGSTCLDRNDLAGSFQRLDGMRSALIGG
jgi:ribulose-phosphate 3-epimerase